MCLLHCRCFREAWREHSAIHASLSFASKKSGSSSGPVVAKEEVLDFVEAVEEDDPSIIVCTDHHYTESPDDWVEICGGAVYTPQPQDVGCVLKIQCAAVSQHDSKDVFAGPVTIYSAVVLSTPSRPPSRPMRVCNPGGWPPGVSTSGNFRVLSYNILAEVYATRQVLVILGCLNVCYCDLSLLCRCTLFAIPGRCHGRIAEPFCSRKLQRCCIYIFAANNVFI